MSQGPWEWEGLRYALALWRAESMSGAARALGVSHTTVSRRVEALERGLGVQLFARGSGGYAVTEVGRAVLEVAVGVEERTAQVERAAMRGSMRVAGPLVFTMVDAFASCLAPALAAYTARHPEVALEVVVSDDWLDLNRREADVALRISEEPPPHLVGRRLGRLRYAPYAAPAIAARGAVDTSTPWLIWQDRPGERMVERWLRTRVDTVRVVGRFDSALVALEAARAGMGAMYMVTAIGEREPGLVRLGPLVEAFEIDAWLLTHPELRAVPSVRVFLREVGDAWAQAIDPPLC